MKDFVVVDLFCGAGGSSNGLLRALERSGITAASLAAQSRRLRLINVNHWNIAIETVRRNIAFAELYNASIENLSPKKVLKGLHIDLLIASSECIMFSQARGDKPIRDQSRSSAAFILDWVKMKPTTLFFENVPEWRTWGPLGPDMRPLPDHKGEYYQAFLSEIRALGYSVQDHVVNCADYGDPTIRKRLFVVGSLQHTASFPMPTHAKNPKPGQKPWVPCSTIIDWSRKGEPITSRERGPHSPPTLRRIAAGYEKQASFAAPILVELIKRLSPIATRFHGILDTRPSDKVLGRKLTKDEKDSNKAIRTIALQEARVAIESAYATPLATLQWSDVDAADLDSLRMVLGQQGGATARGVGKPLPTIAGAGAIGVSEALIVKANASEKSRWNDQTQPVTGPMTTIVGKNDKALAEPVLTHISFGNSDIPLGAPLRALRTGNHVGLAEPTLVCVAHGKDDRRELDLGSPMQSITGKNNAGLAQPVLLHVLRPEGPDDNRIVDMDKPIRTVCGSNIFGLAQPLIAQLYSSNVEKGGTDAVHDPLSTITAGGVHQALAEPVIVSRNNARTGDRRAFTMGEPAPTATGSGAGYLAEPIIVPQQSVAEARSVQQPMPTATGIARIGLAEPFLVPQFGEREGQAPRNHQLTAPAPAVTSHGAGMLVQAALQGIDGPYFTIGDDVFGINILYRMLYSGELAKAHSFGNVQFAGSEQDAVKQIGNSIPVETAAAIIGHIIEPLIIPMRLAA